MLLLLKPCGQMSIVVMPMRPNRDIVDFWCRFQTLVELVLRVAELIPAHHEALQLEGLDLGKDEQDSPKHAQRQERMECPAADGTRQGNLALPQKDGGRLDEGRNGVSEGGWDAAFEDDAFQEATEAEAEPQTKASQAILPPLHTEPSSAPAGGDGTHIEEEAVNDDAASVDSWADEFQEAVSNPDSEREQTQKTDVILSDVGPTDAQELRRSSDSESGSQQGHEGGTESHEQGLEGEKTPRSREEDTAAAAADTAGREDSDSLESALKEGTDADTSKSLPQSTAFQIPDVEAYLHEGLCKPIPASAAAREQPESQEPGRSLEEGPEEASSTGSPAADASKGSHGSKRASDSDNDWGGSEAWGEPAFLEASHEAPPGSEAATPASAGNGPSPDWEASTGVPEPATQQGESPGSESRALSQHVAQNHDVAPAFCERQDASSDEAPDSAVAIPAELKAARDLCLKVISGDPNSRTASGLRQIVSLTFQPHSSP